MTEILSRRLLPEQTDRYILVTREDQVYERIDGEYIPKPYFRIPEAQEILGINRSRIHRYCREMGIQARANHRKRLRITLKQLRIMATKE